MRVVKLLIAVVFFACAAVRGFALRRAGYAASHPFVVLMYHSVKRHEREQFARQMDRLIRVGRPVYADSDIAPCETRRVAVTFDDAYHSVFENAFPVLRDRSIPATFFVPTQYIGGAPGWITDDWHRDADERVLTGDELREMQRGGALIGSHSVTHPRLTDLNQTEILREFTDSRKALEDILGGNVRLFALPYGAACPDVARLAASAGYTRVFLNIPTDSDRGSPVDVVGRMAVDPTDWGMEFYLKIRGAYRWLPAALAAKRWMLNALRTVRPGSLTARRSRRATGTAFPLS